MKNVQRRARGFTIVELLIVIVVIGILAAITIVAYNGIQTRARDTIRIHDVKSLQSTVEAYYATNGSYPLPAGGSMVWTGNCSNFGTKSTYITNVSDILATQPLDPKWPAPTTSKCYLYKSDGVNYMILAYTTMEAICGGDPGNACNSADIQALDRTCCTEPSIAVYSPGAKNW
jgi:prepilin-type N-terminal cleavage/methylation domain-containing protein